MIEAPTAATFVTDPATAQPGDGKTCQQQLYPSPDEVRFCERPAVAILIAPCCGEHVRVCATCLGIGPSLGSWLCLGCGVKTDCRYTPMDFGIRWL